jgi:hypothetical protein
MISFPNRSPTQVVISAAGMVIWVIFWLSGNGISGRKFYTTIDGITTFEQVSRVVMSWR